jgi:hypothetical protein
MFIIFVAKMMPWERTGISKFELCGFQSHLCLPLVCFLAGLGLTTQFPYLKMGLMIIYSQVCSAQYPAYGNHSVTISSFPSLLQLNPKGFI